MTEEEQPSISPELAAWIGYAGPTRPLLQMFDTDVRRYVDATGDTNPLWLDDEFARSMGPDGRLLPPLMVGWTPFSVRERSTDEEGGDIRGRLPLPDEYTHVRNMGSETEWMRMVQLGERLTSHSQIVDISAHRTRLGIGIFIKQVQQMLDEEGNIVCKRTNTSLVLPDSKVDEHDRPTGGA